MAQEHLHSPPLPVMQIALHTLLSWRTQVFSVGTSTASLVDRLEVTISLHIKKPQNLKSSMATTTDHNTNRKLDKDFQKALLM